MKKTIYSLGLILISGLSAQAAVTNMETAKVKETQNITAATSIQNADGDAYTYERISVGHRHAAANVGPEDFVGLFKWKGIDLLGSETGHPVDGTMNIRPTNAAQTEYTITGFCGLGPLNAKFEPSTGHLVIPNQSISYSSQYDQEVWFWNYTVENGISATTGEQVHRVIRNNDTPFYFSLQDDGSLHAGDLDPVKWEDYSYTDAELKELCCIATLIMPLDPKYDGYFFWAERGISATPVEPFSYNADEWEYAGQGGFYDCWFQIFFGGISDESEVGIYRSKTEADTYLVMNPYGANTIFRADYDYQNGLVEPINVSNAPGYIVFNMSDPNCVLVKTFVYALTINQNATVDIARPDNVGYYLTNLEGYYFYELGSSIDDILITLDSDGKYVSSFNSFTRLVEIFNPRFSTENDPVTIYSYGSYTNETNGYIYLPEGFNAVESVLGEEANAPAEYYNLQGVKLANPEKGQIVIVRRGDKAYKQVIR